MSPKFTIAETDTFRESLKRLRNEKVYAKIVSYVYPQLRDNPFCGTNIKKLKGSLDGMYRYRIGDLRMFYVIHEREIMVAVIEIAKRKDAY